MKKIVSVILLSVLLLGLISCGAHADEETTAKTLLYSRQASLKTGGEVWISNFKSMKFIKEQTVKHTKFTYFVFETDSYDWGYAEFADGEANTYCVGYSKSEANRLCKDCAVYRTSALGSLAWD